MYYYIIGDYVMFRCHDCDVAYSTFSTIIEHCIHEHPESELTICAEQLNDQTGEMRYRVINFKIVPSVLARENKKVRILSSDDITSCSVEVVDIGYVEPEPQELHPTMHRLCMHE